MIIKKIKALEVSDLIQWPNLRTESLMKLSLEIDFVQNAL